MTLDEEIVRLERENRKLVASLTDSLTKKEVDSLYFEKKYLMEEYGFMTYDAPFTTEEEQTQIYHNVVKDWNAYLLKVKDSIYKMNGRCIK